MGEVVRLGFNRKQAARRAKQVRAAANRLAFGRSSTPAPTRPGASSTPAGSKQERINEIPGRQTIDRDRRAQDERQPRGRVLEGTERDRGGTERDIVRSRRHARWRSPPGQSVLGDSALRARLLSIAVRRR